jgi:predicted nucleic acid-binding protein
MKLILDTNILVLLVKNKKFGKFFEENYRLKFFDNICYCYITLGELDSIIKQNNWGDEKTQYLNRILKGFELVDLNNLKIVECYGTIDAYSQGKLKTKPLPHGTSSWNMGKNDLWISAVAMSLKGTLITTDRDFEHLHHTFFEVDWIDIQQFK